MANGSWRIARTRGGAHLPLIIVAVLAVALILIGKAQSSLFDRARAAVSDWMSPVLKATAEPLDAPTAGSRRSARFSSFTRKICG